MQEKSKGYLLVILAGLLWSTTGLFANNLMDKGLSSQQVALIRLSLGFIILLIYCLMKDIKLLKINKKIFLYCLLIGFICQAGFNFFYFRAVEILGVSMAAVLLYTSPLFLAILSKVIYKEEIGNQKNIALLICFIGSILAVTGGKFENLNINVLGVVLGILSAISYACMPIISKKILSECKGITILVYGFLFGAIFMMPLAKPLEILPHIKDESMILSILGIGVISASGAYICYIKGISKGIDLSVAGILASGELVGAVMIGWIILGEYFSILKLVGIIFMMLSAIISICEFSSIIYKKRIKNIEFAAGVEEE
ncbi:DMT family transporter [Romboutsia sp.]|uniref:DMT family transporter n=1 Tax=Romboutsia sp. TaxID=1965302 RepID=UPI003F29FFF1